MSKDSKKEQSPDIVINDAVHGVMSFDPKYKDIMKKIIDSSDFQRLRHIKQLGMVDLVFPSAVHTRFNHCLGAAYVASQMALKLKLPEEIEKYAIIGSLLHDIGHGPFSHAFEKLLKYNKNGKEVKIKHEDWTPHFVKQYKEVLEEEKIDYNLISKLIKGKNQGLNKIKEDEMNLVADIISSQLDADRLDYLLRDSHICGVPYGKTDILWIISQLTKIQETGYPPRLGLERKGWRAAEHFLLCRRIMTQNVYHHHKKNVLEELLMIFLTDISDEIKKKEYSL